MIQKIELNNIEHLNQILQLQKKSYLVEAKLLNYYNIPNLQDSIASLKDSNEVFYGYFIESKIIGLISFKIEKEILDIHRLVVDPNHFRQGISSRLLQLIESLDNTIKEIVVQTGKENFPAIMLYKKSGFIEVEEVIVDKKLVITKLKKSI